MKIIKDDRKKFELLYWYFDDMNPSAGDECSLDYVMNNFLHNNPDENIDSAKNLINETFLLYAEEEKMLEFYHTKIFRLLADIISSVEMIKIFPKYHKNQSEFNKDSRALWREISSLLNNGVQLYWMYFPDPKGKDKEFRIYRASLLRSAFDPPDLFMQILKQIRNVHIHFDEYMDDLYRGAIQDGKLVADQLVTSYEQIDKTNSEISRLYDPSTKILYHLGREKASMPTKLLLLNLQELSSMASSIMSTYQINMVVPGWRFRVMLDFVPFWGDSRG